MEWLWGIKGQCFILKMLVRHGLWEHQLHPHVSQACLPLMRNTSGQWEHPSLGEEGYFIARTEG